MRLSVQQAAFDPAAELGAFSVAQSSVGAEVSFTGRVRDDTGTLVALEIEHYPGMTEAAISAIMAEATARWQLAECLVIHRHGRLAPGEAIMMVATAARHRAEAFAAAEYLMDYLKSRAPFWKREITDTGATWVEAKATDEDALTRW
ncbi:molybdenum cofactor biosynthesis protein MoaE [Phaeovulum sp.]|uniref:molybdenum cofactor biosynthesis protein MoaE n=1 Tax=Phaeovulum sp. TaxID=2934796 RepID=UPI0035680822